MCNRAFSSRQGISLIVFLFAFLHLLTTASGAAPAINYWSQSISVDDGTFQIYVVSARLSSVTVRCGLAGNQVGATEPLASIASRNGAIAAINGSFFDSTNPGPIKMPDMPLITHGDLVNYSNAGVLLGFGPDGSWRMERSIDVVHMCGKNGTMQSGDDAGTYQFWSHAQEAIGCGPRLVKYGSITLAPDTDRVNDTDVLSSRTLRSAVGITRDDHIVLVVAHRVILSDMAQIMAKLGCTNAMNMDGGLSSGLWYEGHAIVTPGRNLSNALLIMP